MEYFGKTYTSQVCLMSPGNRRFLEHLHQRSVCDRPCTRKSWMKFISESAAILLLGPWQISGLRKPLKSLLRYKQIHSIRIYWLLPVVSDWPDSLIGPSGLLSVVSPPTCDPSFVTGVSKQVATYLKLGCEKHVWRVTYWGWVEMLPDPYQPGMGPEDISSMCLPYTSMYLPYTSTMARFIAYTCHIPSR
jgi:hypothetical protein